MYVPDGVLTTPCVPGCRSRISWEYDSGEPMTREFPGLPEEIWPATGCTEAHLTELFTVTSAAREHDVWQQLSAYDRLIETSHALYQSSLRHLVGIGGLVYLGTRPSLSGPVRLSFRVPDPNDDDLPF